MRLPSALALSHWGWVGSHSGGTTAVAGMKKGLSKGMMPMFGGATARARGGGAMGFSSGALGSQVRQGQGHVTWCSVKVYRYA